MSYHTLATLKLQCVITPEDLDQCEAKYPGFIEGVLQGLSAKIDARLRKRYAAPFSEPYPYQVTEWLARLSAVPILMRLGTMATDEQFVQIRDDRDAAEKELLEAANSDTGLFDLPLRADTTTNGISKGGPVCSHETDPYGWIDTQRDEIR